MLKQFVLLPYLAETFLLIYSLKCAQWSNNTNTPMTEGCNTTKQTFCFEWYVPLGPDSKHEGGCLDDAVIETRFPWAFNMCAANMDNLHQQVCLLPDRKIYDKSEVGMRRYGYMCCCREELCNRDWANGSSIVNVATVVSGRCVVAERWNRANDSFLGEQKVEECRIGQLCFDFYVPRGNRRRGCTEVAKFEPSCPRFTRNRTCHEANLSANKTVVWLCCCDGFACNEQLDSFADYWKPTAAGPKPIECLSAVGTCLSNRWRRCFTAVHQGTNEEVKGCLEHMRERTNFTQTDIEDCAKQVDLVQIAKNEEDWYYTCCNSDSCNKGSEAAKEVDDLMHITPADGASFVSVIRLLVFISTVLVFVQSH